MFDDLDPADLAHPAEPAALTSVVGTSRSRSSGAQRQRMGPAGERALLPAGSGNLHLARVTLGDNVSGLSAVFGALHVRRPRRQGLRRSMPAGSNRKSEVTTT